MRRSLIRFLGLAGIGLVLAASSYLPGGSETQGMASGLFGFLATSAIFFWFFWGRGSADGKIYESNMFAVSLLGSLLILAAGAGVYLRLVKTAEDGQLASASLCLMTYFGSLMLFSGIRGFSYKEPEDPNKPQLPKKKKVGCC